MPTYEYQCSECEYKFEEFQSMSASPITDCPECSGKTERLISGGAGFVFKGSGFYITDNRSKQYNSDKAKDKKPKADKSTTKKTESKKTDKK